MLRQGNIKLIGEPFPELTLATPGASIAQDGPAATQFLRTQITAGNAQFARIHGFSFEGHYYDLPRPVVMLVHGGGQQLPTPPVNAGDPQLPPTIAQSGQAVRNWEFSTNLREWNYDKMTMSVRLDLESGPLEKILLERALVGDPAAYGGGGA